MAGGLCSDYLFISHFNRIIFLFGPLPSRGKRSYVFHALFTSISAICVTGIFMVDNQNVLIYLGNYYDVN